MKTPKRIQPLVDIGLIDEVIRPLMSGKEADLFVVRCGEQLRCAKVYKDALKRSFKQASVYQEGRKVRNSRRARAMARGSKFGRQQQEDVWQTAEVDALYKLAAADVRVPTPYNCLDGVLLMELVTDAEGDVAPRLGEVTMDRDTALSGHADMMRHVVRMLVAGVVHGDLSEFNVLIDAEGPVIIDLPQAVDAAANNHAGWMLLRDVNNITGYYALFAPELGDTHYGEEIWAHFLNGTLDPDMTLTGQHEVDQSAPDVEAILAEIAAVAAEEQERRARLAEPDPDQPTYI